MAYGALCAMAQRDLRRFVAYASIANAGPACSASARSPRRGSPARSLALFAHGLAAALLLGVAERSSDARRTCDAVRLAGLAGEAPALAALAAAGLAVSLGVPGLAGFWGPLLVLAGRLRAAPGARGWSWPMALVALGGGARSAWRA